MVVRVCEQAQASGARGVTVATDDERIRRAVERFGFRAVMTRAEHASGTDRIAEAAAALGLAEADIVVNVQGGLHRNYPRLNACHRPLVEIDASA